MKTFLVYAIIALILIAGCPFVPLGLVLICPGTIIKVWLAVDVVITLAIIGLLWDAAVLFKNYPEEID